MNYQAPKRCESITPHIVSDFNKMVLGEGKAGDNKDISGCQGFTVGYKQGKHRA